MSEKKRLDQLLVDRGLAPSREKAKSAYYGGTGLCSESKIG